MLCGYMCIYIYIERDTYMYAYMCIYIYIERERGRDIITIIFYYYYCCYYYHFEAHAHLGERRQVEDPKYPRFRRGI